ncbi:MAG: hydrogenase, partial [Deltaproteobacteria bacterium]|nr:hydrogenase [Deltaproteobacteria bacterium]
MFENNPYRPEPAVIKDIIQETANIRTFRIVLNDEEKMRNFSFKPGQVAQL